MGVTVWGEGEDIWMADLWQEVRKHRDILVMLECLGGCARIYARPLAVGVFGGDISEKIAKLSTRRRDAIFLKNSRTLAETQRCHISEK